jgi:hypothetical protein
MGSGVGKSSGVGSGVERNNFSLVSLGVDFFFGSDFRVDFIVNILQNLQVVIYFDMGELGQAVGKCKNTLSAVVTSNLGDRKEKSH